VQTAAYLDEPVRPKIGDLNLHRVVAWMEFWIDSTDDGLLHIVCTGVPFDDDRSNLADLPQVSTTVGVEA